VAGPWTAHVGQSGLSSHHREGDGTTPEGSFPIGSQVYGVAPDPGVHGSYHQLVCGDWWDEDPASPTYNTFQQVGCNTTPPFGASSEALWQSVNAYQHFAVIDYNTNPVVSGAGSGMFIHDDLGGPTSGCVSLAAANLDFVLRWLQPTQTPRAVIGSEADIRQF
jgi:L,D-peptidoglycan transpeptidase YkuD (ErfK/YbiS/YcfS/YnhG family)